MGSLQRDLPGWLVSAGGAVVCFAAPSFARLMLVAESPKVRVIWSLLANYGWVCYLGGLIVATTAVSQFRHRTR